MISSQKFFVWYKIKTTYGYLVIYLQGGFGGGVFPIIWHSGVSDVGGFQISAVNFALFFYKKKIEFLTTAFRTLFDGNSSISSKYVYVFKYSISCFVCCLNYYQSKY